MFTSFTYIQSVMFNIHRRTHSIHNNLLQEQSLNIRRKVRLLQKKCIKNVPVHVVYEEYNDQIHKPDLNVISFSHYFISF